MDAVIEKDYALYNDDCIEVMRQLPNQSVHFSIYSPPFAGLYHYSSSPRDLSNNPNYETFMQHYDFVISEIARLTMPGRMTAVHCMDVPMGNSGNHNDHILDFPGDIVEYHVKCRDENCTASEFERRRGLCGHGWFNLSSRHAIWKEPLGVRNRTMAKKLAHQTIVEDSTISGVAGADYLLVFRRAGKNPEPVAHPYGISYYAGATSVPRELWRYRNYAGKQIENRYSHWIWRQYASSIWDDIRIDNVLPFQDTKEVDDESHVHPLQLDVIERAVTLYSNRGDTVLTPFMGVGSEVYGAAKLDRRAVGIELLEKYFRQAVENMRLLKKEEIFEPTLFEM